MAMEYKDYYAILGVARDADADAIRKAYRKLAQKHHPDVAAGKDAEARFKDIGEAYATLKNPEKRAAYDALGKHRGGERFEPPPEWSAARGWNADGLDEAELADVLAAFGAATHRPRAPRGPRRGQDYEATARITLEEAHRGSTISLDLMHEDGTRTFAVTVPAGVTDGQRLRLRGKGGRGRNGGGDGDIYLHVQVIPHPVFRLSGHDLSFDLALAPWEAALGVDVEVPTLDGPLLLTVPPGTSTGRKLRMRGRGLASGHGKRGDLYAVARIDVPATLSARERELFEELSRVSQYNPRRVIGKEATHGFV
jgi:curved DNA-binding protein